MFVFGFVRYVRVCSVCSGLFGVFGYVRALVRSFGGVRKIYC